MPEGDRFERVFRPEWRGLYRLVRQGGATDAEIGDKCLSTLAEALREGNGVSGFQAIEDIVFNNATLGFGAQTHGAVEEAELMLDTFDGLDQIARAHEEHDYTKIAVQSAKSLLAPKDASVSGESFWPQRGQLAKRVCLDIIRNRFFGNARLNLVAEGKLGDHEKAGQWQDGIEKEMQAGVAKIAEQLMADPSAKSMRAPKRTVKRESTLVLLGEVLVSSEPQG